MVSTHVPTFSQEVPPTCILPSANPTVVPGAFLSTQGGLSHAVPLTQCSRLRITVKEDMATGADLAERVSGIIDESLNE